MNLNLGKLKVSFIFFVFVLKLCMLHVLQELWFILWIIYSYSQYTILLVNYHGKSPLTTLLDHCS